MLPNGVASRRKLKTWVYLRLRLARPSAQLRWLAMTCAHFGRDQICMKVKASFSLFGHPTQVSTQIQLATTCDYLLVRLARALVCILCWLPRVFYNISLLFSPGQTESQVDASCKLGSTCYSVWPCLACTCVDLRWLAMTCAPLRSKSNLHASRRKFVTVWSPNPSQRKLYDVH